MILEAIHRLNNFLTQFHGFSTMAKNTDNDYQ